MVMPFRTRKVEGVPGNSAPAELNCDALWDKALRPALEDLNYMPIRADCESGSLILRDMLERLAFADLVLADISLPNGNVYYEVGLRHAASNKGCILIAADWSNQLFDLEQMRSLRYPLRDGQVSDADATAIRELLVREIPKWSQQDSPWHALVGTSQSAASFQERTQAINALQSRISATRLLTDPVSRCGQVRELLADLGTSLAIPEVATEMLKLVRDTLSWQDMVDLIDSFPEEIRKNDYIHEQELLARSEIGQSEDSIAELLLLIQKQGDTPERRGIIGGRYKRLWHQARDQRQALGQGNANLDEKRYLEKAIENYTEGMELDLNEYYCACNLPSLLIARGRRGDREKALVIEQFVLAACSRADKKGVQDEWLRPTLLGAAFRARDLERASDLTERVELEGGVGWQLESTLVDLATAVDQARDDPAHAELLVLLGRLQSLVAPG